MKAILLLILPVVISYAYTPSKLEAHLNSRDVYNGLHKETLTDETRALFRDKIKSINVSTIPHLDNHNVKHEGSEYMINNDIDLTITHNNLPLDVISVGRDDVGEVIIVCPRTGYVYTDTIIDIVENEL